MGQDRKIKEIARGYEFRTSTRASQEEIVRILDAAASAARRSSQQGTILRTNLRTTQSGFASSWEIKGLGRLVTILAFVVNGRRDASGVTSIEMRLVGDFFYQKGSILGPLTLNGSKVLGRFRELVIAGLGAAPTATTQPLATPQMSEPSRRNTRVWPLADGWIETRSPSVACMPLSKWSLVYESPS